MYSVRMVLLLAGLSLVLTSWAVDTVLPDPATLRTWIANMKESPRGPFEIIRDLRKAAYVMVTKKRVPR